VFNSKLNVAIFLLALLVLSSVSFAFSLTSPDSIEVQGKETYFLVKVFNESKDDQLLKVNFYSTTQSSVSAPKSVASNAYADVKITVFNNNQPNYNEIDSKLEIYLGKDLEEKNITLKMISSGENNSANFFVGLFSLGSFFTESTSFTITEWIVFWVLVIVAAILIIAFISRVTKRSKKEKEDWED